MIYIYNHFHTGRYYVLLCLEEAEHLRGIMHGRANKALIPKQETTDKSKFLTCAALWMKSDTDMTLLQKSKGKYIFMYMYMYTYVFMRVCIVLCIYLCT